MNLIDLETFVLVADCGSMKGAAQRLDVPTSTISRRVARLEDALGMSLLRRAHRSFTLTDHGQHLFVRCAPLFDALSGVVTSLSDQQPEPRGVLRITAPQDLGATAFVSEVLSGFMERWPEVVLDVILTNRRVALAEEGFDIGLRGHGPQIPGSASLMVRRLGVSPIGLFASPNYAETVGLPSEPSALTNHRCLANSVYGSAQRWSLQHSDGQHTHDIAVVPALESNDFGFLMSMAIAGAGICALPLFLAGPSMRADGKLVRALPEWSLPGGYLSLLWPRSRHLAPRVRAFIDFVALAFKSNDDFC